MARPFSLTMQAHRLDLHRLWLVLLAGSTLMILLWLGWAASDNLVVYESSEKVTLSERGAVKNTVEEEGNVARVVATRERFVEARFPSASRGSLTPGQKADVFFRGRPAAEALAAVVTDVAGDDRGAGELRVTLRMTGPQDELEPVLASAPPTRVRIAVGTRRPLDFALAGLASDGGLPGPGGGRARR